jgi:transcriptional regulator NrdR family protein
MPRVKQHEEVVAGQKVGLVCRACGCQHFRVVYLKRLPNGVLMRRRECRYCGKRITTRETATA